VKIKKAYLLKKFFGLSLALAGVFLSFKSYQAPNNDKILSYTVNLKSQNLGFYWQNESGQNFKSILNLKNWLITKNKTLVFATNGGMYKTDNTPLGLFIQDNKIIEPLNNRNGEGNFYLKPNGIFYITNDNKGVVCKSRSFVNNGKIKYATQSGPMLVIDGSIHSAFKEGSKNLNVRNGVGILPNNRVVFAMSKEPINFYDFAVYFKRLGCKNALYLDGFVSRMYLPSMKWIQTDGNFGVIIGETSN